MNLRQLLSQKISFDPQEKLSYNYMENTNLLFDRYLKLLEGNKTDLLTTINSPYHNNSNELIKDIKIFCDQLKTSIHHFYNHFPSKCYKTLGKSISTILRQSRIKSRLIDAGYSFYRIRESKQHLESPSALFHIPFNLRHIISEQRYSLNGCPCLYLGNSIFTAWKECGSLDPSLINIIKLQTLIPLEFLDLRFDIYNQTNITNYSDDDILYFALIFPLIIATNQSVVYPNAQFNAEYVLSKKLTELVKDKYFFDGLMYSSTKTLIQNSALVNYILPTKESIKSDGHCILLKLIFETTDVVKWNEIKMKGLNAAKLNKATAINNEIPNVQLDSNNSIPYNDTHFGELEIHMEQNMPTTKLN